MNKLKNNNDEKKREYFLVCKSFHCVQWRDIKGYNFGENNMNVRTGPENGILRAEMPGYVPPNISICTRIYPENVRDVDQVGLWQIFTPYDTRYPIFNIKTQANGHWRSEFHSLVIKEKVDSFTGSKQWRNGHRSALALTSLMILLKHISMGKRLIKLKWKLLEKRRENNDQKVPKRVFFSYEIIHSSHCSYIILLDKKEMKVGYTIEFVRFYYDNKPINAHWKTDINVWDRMLEKEEFEEVSGCLNLIEGTGNVINKNFSWIITGKLFT